MHRRLRVRGPSPRRVRLQVSHTTRAPRPGETDGVDYHFCDRETMQAAIDAGDFLEHATVHEHLYGTASSEVQRCAAAGKTAVLEIDVQVCLSLPVCLKSTCRCASSPVCACCHAEQTCGGVPPGLCALFATQNRPAVVSLTTKGFDHETPIRTSFDQPRRTDLRCASGPVCTFCHAEQTCGGA